jgi:hypothetical protein
LRYFPSVGNSYGTVKRYNLSKDTYTLKLSDGSWEEIIFGLSKVKIPGTKFSEPTDWSSMLIAPDLEFWMKTVTLEYDT